jgi:hypothetical protein
MKSSFNSQQRVITTKVLRDVHGKPVRIGTRVSVVNGAVPVPGSKKTVVIAKLVTGPQSYGHRLKPAPASAFRASKIGRPPGS